MAKYMCERCKQFVGGNSLENIGETPNNIWICKDCKKKTDDMVKDLTQQAAKQGIPAKDLKFVR